jgi:hypothetical protein
VTPDEYNAREMAINGGLRGSHVTAMTRIAQGHLGLAVDGKCGPATRAALEAQNAPLPTGPRPQTMGEAAVAFAITLIGQGEEGGNNQGPFIRLIGGQPGYEWCALSGGYVWRETIRRAGKTPGRHWYRHDDVPEPGALALIRAIAAASRAAGGPGRITDFSLVRPGDCAALDHGDGHGHFMLIERVDEDGLFHNLEGNVGKYPAKYRRLVRDLAHEPRLWGFARPPEAGL